MDSEKIRDNNSKRTLASTFGILFISVALCASACWLFMLRWTDMYQNKFTLLPVQQKANEQRDALLTPDELDEELRRRLANATEKKVILYWHPPPWYKQAPQLDRKVCGNCEGSLNRSLINHESTKAVIYYSFVGDSTMPSEESRLQDQLHVLWMLEPPTRHMRPQSQWLVKSKFQFNATMSYRRTSDFFGNYDFGFVRTAWNKKPSSTELLKMKTRVGLALVSNCGSTAGAFARLKILQKIQSLNFSMDVFGKCFSSKEALPKDSRETMKEYKFFFSFENSYHCRDYMTEKVFRNGFISYAIPVVWGAEKDDYEAILPEKSFICVEDFSTLESLVKYLQYLQNNDTAYLEYFSWHWKPLPPPRTNALCHLCRALYGINVDDKRLPDYNPLAPPRPIFDKEMTKRSMPLSEQWIFGEDNKECSEKNATKWDFFRNWNL